MINLFTYLKGFTVKQVYNQPLSVFSRQSLLGSVDVDLCLFAAFVGILCKAKSMRCSYAT